MNTPIRPEIEELFELLRFPSISTDSNYTAQTRQCAEWIAAKLNKIGLSAGLRETAGNPIVLAKNTHKAERPTVLIYGHYDVQPVDPIELWDSEPFEPILKGDRIIGRGATDNKGQFFTHVLGVEKILKTNPDLPVNLIFLIEGEEEIGSPNLVTFLSENKDELACDVIVVSDTGMVAPGVPTLSYGLRGITCGELIVSGPAMDLHSGLFGGAVANPATALAQIIASFHDENGKVCVEGFYDDVKPLEDWERKMWANIPGTSAKDTIELTGVPALYGEEGFTPAEQMWARPTAEINGLGGGYQGEGSKTIIPARAFAKFSFRLVPNQDPEKILAQVAKHIEKHAPKGVKVEFELGHSGKPYCANPNSKYGIAAQEALKEAFGADPVLIREGGSIPIITSFREVLGVDSLLIGLALPDCRIHSPNENFCVSNFLTGIEMSQLLLNKIGSI